MLLTEEQQSVIDAVCSSSDNRIIAVNSVAGSGKTSTAKALIEAYQPNRGFYTAFNKAIVEDSKKKFGKLIEAKTIHALAYKFIKPSRSIEELNYLTIKEDIPYYDKDIVIKTLDNFFRSSSTNIEEYAEANCYDPELQDLIIEYANMMLEGKINPTFNFMLKCLHLMLKHKEIQIDFDLFILDECQDTTAVALEIFKLVNAKRKIMLGDSYQNIYSFMNTVNAFEELKDLNLLYLTKSFRCNEYIASVVEEYGKKYLENNFRYKGNNAIHSDSTFKIAYVTRTNAMLIERMFRLFQENQTFSLTRSVNDIFALPIALLNAAGGREVFDKKFKYLEKEYKNYQNVKHNYNNFYQYIVSITEDDLLQSVSKMLINFSQKGINIYKIKEKALEIKKPNKDIILTTAHAFKGLECDNIFIESDLNNSVNRTISKMQELESNINTKDNIRNLLSKQQKEDLNTYYVALSRAKTKLFNQDYIG